jgi:hypothetical protein
VRIRDVTFGFLSQKLGTCCRFLFLGTMEPIVNHRKMKNKINPNLGVLINDFSDASIFLRNATLRNGDPNSQLSDCSI